MAKNKPESNPIPSETAPDKIAQDMLTKTIHAAKLEREGIADQRNHGSPTVEEVAATVFPVLLESFLRIGGRCTPNGYSDVTEEAVGIMTNQAALIAENHIRAMTKWRERKSLDDTKPDADAGQERFA